MRAKLGKDEVGKSKAFLKLEMQLDKWLDQRSLTQVLGWFDCIETTEVQTAMGNYRWSTESVAREQLLLRCLGVIGE